MGTRHATVKEELRQLFGCAETGYLPRGDLRAKATRIGVGPRTLYAWMNGTKTPERQYVERISQVTGRALTAVVESFHGVPLDSPCPCGDPSHVMRLSANPRARTLASVRICAACGSETELTGGRRGASKHGDRCKCSYIKTSVERMSLTCPDRLSPRCAGKRSLLRSYVESMLRKGLFARADIQAGQAPCRPCNSVRLGAMTKSGFDSVKKDHGLAAASHLMRVRMHGNWDPAVAPERSRRRRADQPKESGRRPSLRARPKRAFLGVCLACEQILDVQDPRVSPGKHHMSCPRVTSPNHRLPDSAGLMLAWELLIRHHIRKESTLALAAEFSMHDQGVKSAIKRLRDRWPTDGRGGQRLARLAPLIGVETSVYPSAGR